MTRRTMGRGNFLIEISDFRHRSKGCASSYLRIWSGTLEIRLLMMPRWCLWGCDDCRPLHNLCESFSVLHFSLFRVNFHETWIFWDQFLFYSLISCLKCWRFLWHLSQHITSRSFPRLVHILWTVFALLAVFRLNRNRRSLRSAHAIQVFLDAIQGRSEIEREIESVRRNPSRGAINYRKIFGEKPFRHSRVLANQ